MFLFLSIRRPYKLNRFPNIFDAKPKLMYTMRDLCCIFVPLVVCYFFFSLFISTFLFKLNLTISISELLCALSGCTLIDLQMYFKMCNNLRMVGTSSCMPACLPAHAFSAELKWTNLTQTSSNFQPLRQLFCQNGDDLRPLQDMHKWHSFFSLLFRSESIQYWRKYSIFLKQTFFFLSLLFAVHFIAHWLDTIFMNRLFAIRLETGNKCQQQTNKRNFRSE